MRILCLQHTEIWTYVVCVEIETIYAQTGVEEIYPSSYYLCYHTPSEDRRHCYIHPCHSRYVSECYLYDRHGADNLPRHVHLDCNRACVERKKFIAKIQKD